MIPKIMVFSKGTSLKLQGICPHSKTMNVKRISIVDPPTHTYLVKAYE